MNRLILKAQLKQDVSQRTAALAAARCRLRRAHREAVTLLGKAHSLPRRLQRQLESLMAQQKKGGWVLGGYGFKKKAWEANGRTKQFQHE